jgi:hypothetical protein
MAGLGGLLRLLGVALQGWPPWPHRQALVRERGVVPFLAFRVKARRW